jgi:heat shock protein HtpX
MFKRIILFMAVNLLIVLTISVVTSLLGVNQYVTSRGLDYQQLMVFCLVWGMGGAFLSLAISRWIAKFAMGVQVLEPNTTHAEGRWLVQSVHRLAKQAGMTVMPEVGLYESEEPNAFATGPTRNRALVAVSSGMMQRMDKNQVEGVLGHEITHIVNGDMVTMTLLQGVVNAFVMFFARVIGFAVAQAVRGEKEEFSPMVMFIVTMVLQIFLGILGMTVVAWFSRAREFRADAGGARLAGREKMIGALEGLKRVFELPAPQEAAQPASIAAFKISGRPGGGLASLFATHPPLDDRIAALKRGVGR